MGKAAGSAAHSVPRAAVGWLGRFLSPAGWLTHACRRQSAARGVAQQRRDQTGSQSGCPSRGALHHLRQEVTREYHRDRPHESSLTAVALQPIGEVDATIRLEVNRDTVALLRAWAERWPQRRWAVEGAAALGRGVAQGRAARAQLLNTGHARKTDPIDAAAVEMVAQHHRRLHRVRAEDDSLVLRLLSERRDDLAGERTRTANRLHALFRDLIPGGAKRNLSAQQGAALLRGVHRRLSWACMSGVVCQ